MLIKTNFDNVFGIFSPENIKVKQNLRRKGFVFYF